MNFSSNIIRNQHIFATGIEHFWNKHYSTFDTVKFKNSTIQHQNWENDRMNRFLPTIKSDICAVRRNCTVHINNLLAEIVANSTQSPSYSLFTCVAHSNLLSIQHNKMQPEIVYSLWTGKQYSVSIFQQNIFIRWIYLSLKLYLNAIQ